MKTNLEVKNEPKTCGPRGNRRVALYFWSEDEHEMIKRAAAHERRTISSWVIAVAIREAKRILKAAS